MLGMLHTHYCTATTIEHAIHSLVLLGATDVQVKHEPEMQRFVHEGSMSYPGDSPWSVSGEVPEESGLHVRPKPSSRGEKSA